MKALGPRIRASVSSGVDEPTLGQAQRIPGHMPTNTASLQGTVRDPRTKLGIPGVKISLLRAGVVVREKWTDAEGIFPLC
jgi:hypothetical protein